MLPRSTRPLAIGVSLAGLTTLLSGCSAPAVDHHYSDGTYAATGRYSSPGGPQGIHVAVQLKNDVIKWLLVTPSAFIGEPAEFQARFALAIPDEVIGKDIDQVDVARIAGSSLTSIAFNQALDEIKSAANEP